LTLPVYCLIPENIIWANTTAVETGAALFAGLSVVCGLVYLKTKDLRTFFIFSVMTAFSIQLRHESVLIFVVVVLLFLLEDRKIFCNHKVYIFLALALALIIPHLVQLYAISDENWGSSGPKFGLKYIKDNFNDNFSFYFNNTNFPILFSILFGFGFIGKSNHKIKIIMGCWFFLFFGIFLLFYAGSYKFGQDVRFSIVSYMPLSLLASLGIMNMENYFQKKNRIFDYRIIVFSAIFFSFISLLPHIRTIGEEACQARADHQYAKEMAKILPDDAIILTHNPNMFLLWGKNAAQAAIATNNETLMKSYFKHNSGGVYFHYNYWCNVDDPREKTFCQNILDKYEKRVHMTRREKDYKFIMYQLYPKE